MVTVKVELTSARTGRTRLLGVMAIANNNTGTAEIGNYDYTLQTGLRGKKRKGKVKGYRRVKDPVWKLLHMVMQDAGVI